MDARGRNAPVDAAGNPSRTAAGPRLPEATARLDVALDHASRLLGSDPALAGRQAEEILRVVDGHPAAQLILAASLRLTGRPAEALALLETLVQAQPQAPLVHYEHGLVLGRLGRGEAAVAALRRAVALQPTLARAWLALADHLRAIGDTEGADAAHLAHVRHSVRDPALLEAGEALAADRLPEAEARLKARLQQQPTDVAAIRMLAELAVRVGRTDEALHLLERCLELAPGFREARQHYALVLHRDQQSERALVQLDRVLADDPHNPCARTLRAAILCRLGDYA